MQDITGQAPVDVLETIRLGLLAGDEKKVVQNVTAFLEQQNDPRAVLEEALIPGMAEVGERMGRKEIFIPEVLVAALCMKRALEIIRPILAKDAAGTQETIILGTVKGDVHDIGKNLIGYMLEGAGFNVVDLGVNVPSEKFAEAVTKHRANVIGMSAMLTTTMQEMGGVVRFFEKEGLRGEVRIMIGGAPVDMSFAKNIGADGYAPDAGDVVREVRRLLSASPVVG